MKPTAYILGLLLAATLTAQADGPQPPAAAAQAPAFTLTDTDGKQHSLADYAGKIVVLEWTNPGCPFVVRAYEKQGMPRMQKDYTGKGVIWLSINSTNTSHGDFLPNDELKQKFTAWEAANTAVLVDADGTVGRAYGAKTTPHMFVIDATGALVYEGAVDDDPRGTKDAAERTVYVRQVLDALIGGQPSPLSNTKPYGCSVKYGS